MVEEVVAPRMRRAWRDIAWFLRVLWDQLGRDQVFIRAAGLAYSALLATVPLVAVLIGLLSAFGALEDIRARLQDALVTRLLPSNHDQLAALLDQFLAGASKVGLVGFVFLILTAILLMDAVESSFNRIWQVSTRRRLISKVTAYTSVLVFGSLFIGASLSISARLKTALILHGPALDPGLVSRLQSMVFPLLLSLLAFLLMFVVIPFTRVHWTSALLGALVGSVLWEVAKSLFALSVDSSVRYSTLYGSLAAIPIFLIWLNITWIIVLLGLEVAYTHQHFHALRRERLWRSAGSGARLALGLKLYAALARAFDRGEEPPRDDELAERFEVPLSAVQESLQRFETTGLTRRAVTGSEDDGVVPAMPLSRVTVAGVVATLLDNEGGRGEPDEPLVQAVEQALARYRDAGAGALGDTTFEDLVRDAESVT